VKNLETAINRNLNGLIYEGSNISDKDLSIKVWKAQNFTFSIKNNVIEYRIPVKIWSRFTWKVQKFGLSVGDSYEATGTIALNYKTTLSIDKNWKIVAKTTSSGYQWIETPRLNVVGVSVPVTPIASFALSQSDKKINEQIDKILAQSVDLKKYVTDIWSQAQDPMQVNTEYNLWLRILPKDIYVSPFTTNQNKLNLAISLHAQIESFMGAKPLALAKTPLPDYKVVLHPAQQFNLNIATDVTYEKMAEEANKELLGKTFTEGNRSITITGLSIYGSEGKPVFVADVTGSLKGRIYFTGKLVYNKENTSVEVAEPEFDVKTKNSLVKSANWLMHGFILKKITPYLTYSVKDDLEKGKNQANNMLNSYKITDGASLQGKLNTIEVKQLDLVPGALRIQSNVKGSVSLKIDDLKF